MNIPLAFETAVNAILADSADLSTVTKVRTWQKLANDCKIDNEGSRAFPMVDIRAHVPMTDENQVTLHSDIEIVCATYGDDDKLHATIQSIYGKVQGVIDTLYMQWRNTAATPTAGTVYALFADTVEANIGAAGVVNIGGFSFQEGLAPYDDDGRNMIGLTLRVHYSRSDF